MKVRIHTVSAILTAAGRGTRLLGRSGARELPKAFQLLQGVPLIFYSLKSLLESELISEIIITLPKAYAREFKAELESTGRAIKPVRVASGGASRALSVYEGIKKVSRRAGLILVHDAARPLVGAEEINAVIREAARRGAAIAARRVTSTIKEAGIGRTAIVRTIARENLWEAETPQAAKKEWLLEAYRHFLKHPFPATDEASLLERIGKNVSLVELSRPNVKITTAQDMELVSGMLHRESETRVGFGSDTHRLVEGRPLILGGEIIPHKRGSLGHSDGDALLHAISDAILGAIGKGDIGQYFSDQNKKFKNIPSIHILNKIVELAREAYWHVVNVDCVIHLERPRLSEFKSKIKNRLAEALGISHEQVNVKAKTKEGLDAVGRCGAVSCEAVVLMKKGLP
ncbi:MAG: 2-C-methyl-D-erythritol 2,4-cyclodiphosphate synthase [Candidatus Omnitrophica bacterium]|nr:2-C-methyl-D-erythritol 2,4-cyclodiphosphate synthase [Candidatus Omnitrophota bacterium]